MAKKNLVALVNQPYTVHTTAKGFSFPLLADGKTLVPNQGGADLEEDFQIFKAKVLAGAVFY